MGKVPEYMFTRKFLFLTVLFITVFSIMFLKLYSPFSQTFWLTLQGNLLLGTISIYTVSVLFLLLSKVILIDIHRKYTVGPLGLLFYSVSEVLVISVFYVVVTKLMNPEIVSPIKVFPKAFGCLFLILVIPYLLCYLYGYAHGLKMELSDRPVKSDANAIVSIHDNRRKVKLSLRVSDILYAVSEDNYVKVFYEQNGELKNTMIRTTAKNIENDLEGAITRCHRSYLVNISKVRFFNNDRDNLYVLLDREGLNPIPVSRPYREMLSDLLGGKE